MSTLNPIFPITCALALCGLFLTGCEEDVVSGDTSSMSAEVNGEHWEATKVTARGNTAITISAQASDASGILLTFPGDATVGDHDLGTSTEYVAAYLPTASDNLMASGGVVRINVINESQVSGTFSFDATQGTTTVLVRNGTFQVYRE